MTHLLVSAGHTTPGPELSQCRCSHSPVERCTSQSSHSEICGCGTCHLSVAERNISYDVMTQFHLLSHIVAVDINISV